MAPLPARILTVLLLAAGTAAAGDVKTDAGAELPGGQPQFQKVAPISNLGASLNPVGDLKTAQAPVDVPTLSSLITPEPGAAAAQPQAQGAEFDIELVVKDGKPELVSIPQHQVVEPYFVGALARLGVPQDLARRLASYQAKRHPGDADKIYHGLAHSQDVPAVVAAVIEDKAGAGLTDKQKVLLILAAVLHDIDPLRKPETPARVAATLEYLDNDPDSVALLSEFSRRYGISRAEVKTLIKATDFNADPSGQKKIQEDFEARVKSSFPANEQAWALEWGRKLSFADKSATYLGSVEAADHQVRSLANEIRNGIAAASGKETANPSDESMLRGSKNFLKVLKGNPDYAILPAALRQNFEKVYAHFERLADPATPIPAENAQARGPPQAADAAVRRLALEPSSADRDLAALRTEGYAVLAPGALMDAAAEKRVLDIIDAKFWNKGDPVISILTLKDPTVSGNSPFKPGLDRIYDEIKPSVDLLTSRLNTALAGEGIVARDIQIRLRTPGKPDTQFAHVDLGGYMTATFALRGRGTVLYSQRGGAVGEREAPTHSWTIVSNLERELRSLKEKWASAVLGTVHDTPVTDRDRVIMIIRFERANRAEMSLDEEAAMRARAEKRVQAYLAQLARQGRTGLRGQGSAPERKKGGIFSGLFGSGE